MISQQQLEAGLEALYNKWSNDPKVDPAEARKQIAKGQAALIAQFVIGRQTVVAGVQSGAGSATGIIQG